MPFFKALDKMAAHFCLVETVFQVISIIAIYVFTIYVKQTILNRWNVFTISRRFHSYAQLHSCYRCNREYCR